MEYVVDILEEPNELEELLSPLEVLSVETVGLLSFGMNGTDFGITLLSKVPSERI